MTLRDLKIQINNNTIPEDLIIFVCEDSYYLADEYVDEICSRKHLSKNVLSSLGEITNSTMAFLMDFSASLNVLRVDEFNEFLSDYSGLKNCIIICQSVNKTLESTVNDFVVKVPKLQDWQVKEYINVICPGLEEREINWLYKVCKGQDSIYKIKNEIDKLLLFSEEKRREIFIKMCCSSNTDLFDIDLGYELLPAILSGNKTVLYSYFLHTDATEISAIQLIGIILANIKRIILVCFSLNSTPEEIGITPAQFKYLKTHNTLSKEKVLNILEFLTELDTKIKSGNFDMPEEIQKDYIIEKILLM